MSKVGFPIRKSTDRRLFAPSRSLSQRTTSFIASYRQGIHQMPLGHLIALISNAHPSPTRFHIPGERRFDEPSFRQSGVHCSERPEVNQNKPEFQPDACAPARTPPRPPCGGTLSGTQTSTFAPRLIPSSRCQVNRHRVIGPRAGSCCFFEHRCRPRRSDCTRDAGGARRDRTDDLKLAKLALSQLSYGPDPDGDLAERQALPGSNT